MKKYNKPLFSVIEVDNADIIQTSTVTNVGAGSSDKPIIWLDDAGTYAKSPAKDYVAKN